MRKHIGKRNPAFGCLSADERSRVIVTNHAVDRYVERFDADADGDSVLLLARRAGPLTKSAIAWLVQSGTASRHMEAATVDAGRVVFAQDGGCVFVILAADKGDWKVLTCIDVSPAGLLDRRRRFLDQKNGAVALARTTNKRKRSSKGFDRGKQRKKKWRRIDGD